MTAHGYIVSFWGDENVLELVVMVIHPYEYTKTTELYLERVSFIVYKLYLNKTMFRSTNINKNK